MRLEEEYRRRLNGVTKEVKKRLDYQVCRIACFLALSFFFISRMDYSSPSFHLPSSAFSTHPLTLYSSTPPLPLLYPSSTPPPPLLHPSFTPPPPLHHPSSTPPLSLLHPSFTPPPPLLYPSTTPPPPSIPPPLLHPSVHLQVDMEKLQHDFEQAHLVQWLEKAVIDRLKAAQVESVLPTVSMFMTLFTHVYMPCPPPHTHTHTHTHHHHPHTHTHRVKA